MGIDSDEMRGHNRGVFQIRPAEFPTDLSAVRALLLEYAQSLDFRLCFQSFDEELATLPGKYAPPGGCVLLAEADGLPFGIVALRALSEGVCEMKRLYVQTAFRRKRAGRALAEAVIVRAGETGYRLMRLDTVSSMAAALQLYRSLGFHPIDPYCVNPLPNAVYMERTL